MKILLILGALWAHMAFGAIPKASMILQRTSENAGNGLYQIDQEVQFPNGPETLSLRETWLIENENNMKLLVTGTKELKGLVAFTLQIQNGNRLQESGGKRITEDFIERYFHFRTKEALAQSLAQMKLVPGNVLAHRPLRTLKDVDFQPENFVRLARSGGVVTYAFGPLANPTQETPGFWIEQDQFVIRKFRLLSSVEVSADQYSPYSKGLMFPRTRTVRWGDNQVTIQTISVSSRPKESWATFAQKVVPKTEPLASQPGSAIIQDFYKRFR